MAHGCWPSVVPIALLFCSVFREPGWAVVDPMPSFFASLTSMQSNFQLFLPFLLHNRFLLSTSFFSAGDGLSGANRTVQCSFVVTASHSRQLARHWYRDSSLEIKVVSSQRQGNITTGAPEYLSNIGDDD